jgi:hypothetical protein
VVLLKVRIVRTARREEGKKRITYIKVSERYTENYEDERRR